VTDTVQTMLAVSWALSAFGGFGAGMVAMEHLDAVNIARRGRGEPEATKYPALYAVAVGLVTALLGPLTCAAILVTAFVCVVRFVRMVTAKPPADLPPVTNGSYRGCTCVVAHDGPCAGPGRVHP